MTLNNINCATCKVKDICNIGYCVKDVSEEEMTFEDKLLIKYFDCVGQYEPPQKDITTLTHDMSTYFSTDMREFILTNILNNRTDKYTGTPNESSYIHPIYEDDIETIKNYKEKVTISNVTSLTGIEYLTSISDLEINVDKIFALDLRSMTKLKSLKVTSSFLRFLYLPTVESLVDDYDNVDTHGIELHCPRLEYFDMRTMKETRSGLLNPEVLPDMKELKFIVIPKNCDNQDFTNFDMDKIFENCTLVPAVRMEFNAEEVKNGYKVDLTQYKRLNWDLISSDFIDSTCTGEYNYSESTIKYGSDTVFPQYFMLNEHLVAFVTK